ncbi:MAG: hypothetical protein UH249_09760 [Acutalibacteraceae bacterium]|nr:hypothetical protein [Acutalibacteraceae bacterium]
MKNHKLNLLLVNAFLVVNILIYILIPFVNVSFVKNPVTISIYCVGLAGMAILEIFLSKEYKRIPADKETEKEVKIKELQVEEEYISYAKQSEFVEKSRKIRHDFNNILQITNSLICLVLFSMIDFASLPISTELPVSFIRNSILWLV